MTAPPANAAASTTLGGDCFHCGEALDNAAVTRTVGGQPRRFCCTGCAGAAEWIAGAGLSDYYRLRQAQALRVDEADEDLSLWDRPEVQAEHVRNSAEGNQVTVLTDGMRCAACAWLIDRGLTRRDGVREVVANAMTGRVRITWDAERARLSQVLGDLAALGYRAHLSPGQAREDARRRARRASLLRLGVAGLGAMQAMMLAQALFLDFAQEMPIPTRDFLRWLTFFLSTPVVFYSGWPFISGMWNELRLRRFGMDTLVATSVLLAYFASLLETIRGGVHVWFDAAVMFVLFLLIAREIETAVRARAVDFVDTLARARPAFATRESPDGSAQQVPVAALAADDVVRVAAGESVPADGVAITPASFDESLLTGESVPVRRAVGEEVRAGSIAVGGVARVRVVRVGQDTWISQLSRLIERAQDARPAAARLADAIASRFVLVLFACAAMTCLWWLRHEPSRAFEVTLAVLVVACPCALSLAIPAALASAHTALARRGVLALGPDALATLARVDTVVFDKTGTLTCGQPMLREVETFGALDRDQALAIAQVMERDSTHPLAWVFRAQLPPGSQTELAPRWHEAEVATIAGAGLETHVDGQRWRLGHAPFATGGSDDGAIWLGDGEHGLARFMVGDALRPDAQETLAACRAVGLECELLSGDGEAAVATVAAALDIPRWASRRTPEQKLARIRELQGEGRVVLMVGDGINDAPVLGGANASMAMHSGAALAHAAADFVLTVQRLDRVPDAVRLARRTRATIRQNLAWALGYNAIAVCCAAAGWVAPWLAALGMAASSLLVTLNALRLARVGPRGHTDSSADHGLFAQ